MLPCFIEIPFLNINNIGPDQMPYTAVSDLGLRCLQVPLLWDARHKWVNRDQNAPKGHAESLFIRIIRINIALYL